MLHCCGEVDGNVAPDLGGCHCCQMPRALLHCLPELGAKGVSLSGRALGNALSEPPPNPEPKGELPCLSAPSSASAPAHCWPFPPGPLAGFWGTEREGPRSLERNLLTPAPTSPSATAGGPCAGTWLLPNLWTTAFVAFLTVSCQSFAWEALRGWPDERSKRPSRYPVQEGAPDNLSRRIISCRPIQFLPSPLPSFDQTVSPPATARCSNKKASRVLDSAEASGVPGLNFAPSTACMLFQSLRKPPRFGSSLPRRCCLFRTACSPETSAKSAARGQKCRAWKAASAFEKVLRLPGSRGISSGRPPGPRSKWLPRKAPPQNSSQASLPATSNAITPTSFLRADLGSSNFKASGLGSRTLLPKPVGAGSSGAERPAPPGTARGILREAAGAGPPMRLSELILTRRWAAFPAAPESCSSPSNAAWISECWSRAEPRKPSPPPLPASLS
mmetsp:Transcript_89589/g.261899  ORF Transcript_89589/g.261899 Transcript_89589/m.261899 type:complete len:445 (+) Transcript_89589:151-1485(+)